MSRLINLILFLFVLVGAVWVYQVKHEAKQEEEKIAKLERDIAKEKEALLLLKAEWSYLNRPQRVQKLSERFAAQLGLKEVEPYQIGNVADLPERQVGPALSGADKSDLDALVKKAQPANATIE